MASVSEVAREMCHALNNVAASLFASLSYLESVPVSEAAGKALRNLESACGSTRALAAASFLLSLDHQCSGTFPPAQQDCFRLEREALLSIADTLGEVAAIEYDAALPLRGSCLAIDVDTLAAALVCLAFDLRRHAPPGARILLDVVESGDARQGTARVCFAFCIAADDCPVESGGRKARPHLCAWALAHVVALYPTEALDVVGEGSERRQLSIACVMSLDGPDAGRGG